MAAGVAPSGTRPPALGMPPAARKMPGCLKADMTRNRVPVPRRGLGIPESRRAPSCPPPFFLSPAVTLSPLSPGSDSGGVGGVAGGTFVPASMRRARSLMVPGSTFASKIRSISWAISRPMARRDLP